MVPIGAISLLLILIIMLFLNYKNNGGIYSPTVLLCGMYSISSFCYILYSAQWKTDLSLLTVSTVSGSLLMFSLGEILANRLRVSRKKVTVNNQGVMSSSGIHNYLNADIYIPRAWFTVLMIISIVTLYLHFQYTKTLAIAGGNKLGIKYMINFAYYAKYNLDSVPNEPFYTTIGLVCSHCFAYICLFVFSIRIITKRFNKRTLIYLIPVAIYILQVFLNGGRTSFIRIIIYFILMTLAVNYHWKGAIRIGFKTVIRIIFCMVVFLIVYRSYGIYRGSMNTAWDTILSYPGTSLQAFNVYMASPTKSTFFGQETLTTILHILNKLGFHFQTGILSLPSAYWTNGSTNIYTALRRYVADYSLLGAGIIMFSLGLFYGRLKQSMMNKGSFRSIMFYSMFMYPIIEFIFEERFMIGILSVGTIYYIIIISVLERAIRSRK